jgi:hypothetical protein
MFRILSRKSGREIPIEGLVSKSYPSYKKEFIF